MITKERLDWIENKAHEMHSCGHDDFDLAEPIDELLREIDELSADRDEWRTQHDNAVACWYRERDYLASKIKKLEQLILAAGLCVPRDFDGWWKRASELVPDMREEEDV